MSREPSQLPMGIPPLRTCRVVPCLSYRDGQAWDSGLSTWTAAPRGLHLSPSSEKSVHGVEERLRGAGREQQWPTVIMTFGEVGGTEPGGCMAGKGESELTSPGSPKASRSPLSKGG